MRNSTTFLFVMDFFIVPTPAMIDTFFLAPPRSLFNYTSLLGRCQVNKPKIFIFLLNANVEDDSIAFEAMTLSGRNRVLSTVVLKSLTSKTSAFLLTPR